MKTRQDDTIACRIVLCRLPAVRLICSIVLFGSLLAPCDHATAATLPEADASYQMARIAEQQSVAQCVDYYYQAAIMAWDHCVPRTARQLPDASVQRAWQIYHWSVAGLIRSGQQHGRISPSRGLLINAPSGAGVATIAYTGFPWTPDDFDRLVVVDPNESRLLRKDFREYGFGVALVAFRERAATSQFMTGLVPFAATAYLQPNSAQHIAGTAGPPQSDLPIVATLHLVDPFRFEAVEIDSQSFRVTRDLSAPLAAAQELSTDDPITAFIRPGQPREEDGLKMIEPYQRGKIPLVMIHGLASNRLTWVNLANELRANPWVNERYQIWYFQYPTGEPFLRSAVTLRRQLTDVLRLHDPLGEDPLLSQMVIVGHSMGGLVAKMQVTYSGTIVWDHIAYRPMEQIVASPQQRQRLQELFYFQPTPGVKRVVFIGTPHGGSSWATRSVGRIASSMVTPSPERTADHQLLVSSNPGVFVPSIRPRIPTSVDLLEPTSPLLAAMSKLYVNPEVTLHSIIGTNGAMLWAGPSDGVVPVESARHPGVASERFIRAGHSDLQRDPETVAEVLRILQEHVHAVDTTVNF